MRARRDFIPGGKGDRAKRSDFDPRQLRVGCKIEREHTRSNKLACEIAMDHLTEDGRYYSKLCQIHREKPCRLLNGTVRRRRSRRRGRR
jgi:hypothetical protein